MILSDKSFLFHREQCHFSGTMERNEDFFRQSIDNSTLGNILNSITAELETPPSGLTFADKLINAFDRERFISEMKSLTKGVVVHTKVRKHDEYGRVYAYEVQIIPRESKLVVTKQVALKFL